MVIKSEVIRKRLNKLDEYLQILHGMQKYTLEEFLSDPEHYASVERFLHMAIETTIDIGGHIVSGLGMGEVNWYSDIAAIMEEKGYITVELREKWIRIVGFRNVLVHQYIEVDRKIVYDVLQNKLGDIEELKEVFASFL
ncbi:MAG: DUF86 domain-containing protein [Chloroflexi bacterium]|nr:DUF86 domain-containing protein [Chloroflexota bacterium]